MQLVFIFFPVLLLLLYSGLLIYYRYAWQSIPAFKPTTLHAQPVTFISVIIPARNEADRLPALLKSLSTQSYPAELFEVLVVDDYSTDATAAIVNSFPAANTRLICLKDFLGDKAINSYKKKAVDTGISQAKGTLIISTDADCIVPPTWIENFAAFYKERNAAFIAAPVAFLPFKKGDGTGMKLLHVFQSLDFMTLQGITGASVYKRLHSMCNGANMAYEKQVFDEVGGFAGIDDIASGDDMLLMHKIYQKHPGRVVFLKSRHSIVETAAARSIRDFLNQRIRWASKADKYDDKRIFPVLLLVYLLNVMLLAMPLIALLKNDEFSILNCRLSIIGWWVLFLTWKTAAELFFLFPVARFFGRQKLLWFFPLMQPFHILYTVIAGWLGKFGSYQWKDRKVN